MVATKRRVVLTLHHLEWAWSLLYAYPELSCYELGPQPAPAAKQLWEAPDDTTWKRRYAHWLRQWKDGPFRMDELFDIQSSGPLNSRTEKWLAESDEYGVLIMTEGIRHFGFAL